MTQDSVLFPKKETSKEKFVWRATYEDGTVVNQKEDGKETSSDKLARKGLRKFEVLEETVHGDTIMLKLQLIAGDKFAFRRRMAIKASFGLLARYYGAGITRDGHVSILWLDEDTKTVELTRHIDGRNDATTDEYWKHNFAFAENDDVEIS